MNREDTHTLFAQEKDAWNKWANKMLAQKKALQDTGTWDMGKDPLGNLEPKTDETRAWFKAASVVFSTTEQPRKFETDVDFQSWIFPANACFDGAKFERYARFARVEFGGDVWFMGATFGGDASFDGATFPSFAGFEGAIFSGEARFVGAEFGGVAWFKGVKFARDASFNGVIFAGFAGFEFTEFGGAGAFERAMFAEEAWFKEAIFAGTATFTGGTFKYNTTFKETSFQGPALFTAIHSNRAFSLEGASFQKVPDFIQAKFLEAPRLDNVDVSPGWMDGDTSWEKGKSCWKRFLGGDRDVPARWRALKRLAIQGHDSEREQQFFPMEIKSARFVTDWPIHWRMLLLDPTIWTGFFRFWFGKFYQIFSDFGRSVLRPMVWWIAVVAVCFCVYIGEHPAVKESRNAAIESGTSDSIAYPETAYQAWLNNQHCVTDDKIRMPLVPLASGISSQLSAANEALRLTLSNAVVFGNLGGNDSTRLMYGCLYGLEQLRKSPENADSPEPANYSHAGLTAIWVPPLVATFSTIQRFLSAILIFLFGLAIRNMLKMH